MHKMDKLTKIFNSIALISGETELEPVLTELAQMGKELVSADRCTVWLYDKQTDENWTLVAQGIEPIRVPKTQVVSTDSLSSPTIERYGPGQ